MTDLKKLKDLQETTGAGLGNCKKALEANDGDPERAARWLQRRGLAPDLGPAPVDDWSDERKESIRRGYRFDSWVEALARRVIAEVPSASDLGRVQRVSLEMDDLSLWPMFLTVEGTHKTIQTEPFSELFEEFEIPGNKDMPDSVAELFVEERDLDQDHFSFYEGLVGELWYLGLSELEIRVRNYLTQAGHRFQEGSTCQVLIHGDSHVGGEKLVQDLQGYLQEECQDDELLKTMAGICYETPSRREWLRKLRDHAEPQMPIPTDT